MAEMPEKIKIYEKRFGNIAIEKGFITKADLIHALKLQVQDEIEKIEHRLIGQILFELKIMSAEQIKEVLSELFKKEK
jgi:hypothetical protein